MFYSKNEIPTKWRYNPLFKLTLLMSLTKTHWKRTYAIFVLICVSIYKDYSLSMNFAHRFVILIIVIQMFKQVWISRLKWPMQYTLTRLIAKLTMFAKCDRSIHSHTLEIMFASYTCTYNHSNHLKQ